MNMICHNDEEFFEKLFKNNNIALDIKYPLYFYKELCFWFVPLNEHIETKKGFLEYLIDDNSFLIEKCSYKIRINKVERIVFSKVKEGNNYIYSFLGVFAPLEESEQYEGDLFVNRYKKQDEGEFKFSKIEFSYPAYDNKKECYGKRPQFDKYRYSEEMDKEIFEGIGFVSEIDNNASNFVCDYMRLLIIEKNGKESESRKNLLKRIDEFEKEIYKETFKYIDDSMQIINNHLEKLNNSIIQEFISYIEG